MIFVGIKPGQRGSVCILDYKEEVKISFIDMPLIPLEDRDGLIAIDGVKLRELLVAAIDVSDVQILVDSPVFTQSTRAKGFEKSLADYGVVETVLTQLEVRYSFLHQTTWQLALNVLDAPEGPIWLVQNLYPQANLVRGREVNCSSERAKALLIAEYGRRSYTRR